MFKSQDLSQAESDFASPSSQFAALALTQTFASLVNNTTITGIGGDNIIQVGLINLNNKSLTLSGTPSSYFIFNVTSDLFMSSVPMTLSGGVTPNKCSSTCSATGLRMADSR